MKQITVSESEWVDLKELIAAQIFDFDYESDTDGVRRRRVAPNPGNPSRGDEMKIASIRELRKGYLDLHTAS